ncbi:MAG: polysaccharide export protein EpsE [Burkholderiaceae bacterium]
MTVTVPIRTCTTALTSVPSHNLNSREWVRALVRVVTGLVAALSIAAFVPTAHADTVAPSNYELGAGDSIRVTVFQNPDMTVETRVSEDGSISYPLVGRVVIGGLAIGAAEKKIAAALKDGGFLKGPQINIQLMEIRGNKVSVLGQVNRAGSFPLQTTTTRVSQMLAEAGGVTTIGDDRLIVTGTRAGNPFRREIDMDALYRNQRPDDDIVLAGGDTIYVPRAPMFFIYGEVVKPGSYRIERGMTMRQALAAGGGLTLRGTERRLKVVRANAAGVSSKISVDLDDPVRPGDVVTVSESFF